MSVVEIVMPRLSGAMEQGTIVRWLKDVGDQIERRLADVEAAVDAPPAARSAMQRGDQAGRELPPAEGGRGRSERLPLTVTQGEIARETAALIERVRSSSSTPADLQDGTFTVSNLGMYGISAFDSIVNTPEVAILSVGAAQPRALVDEAGAVTSRPYATLTLACDHRAVYGADGAAFLARLRALLESPEVLVL